MLKKISLIALLITTSYLAISSNPIHKIQRVLSDPFKFIRLASYKNSIEQEMSSLGQKLKEHHHHWIEHQIHEDFSHITNKVITKSNYEATEKFFKTHNIRGLRRIKIIDGQIYYTAYGEEQGADKRTDIFLETLRTLSQNAKLPNIDFFLYEGDILNEKIPDNCAPIFTFAANKYIRQNKILTPDSLTLKTFPKVYYEVLYRNEEVSWGQKIDKAYWRGSSTGVLYDNNDFSKPMHVGETLENYTKFPRVKLAYLSKEYPELLDAKFTNLCQMDTQTKARLMRELGVAPHTGKDEQLKYKIQITMDGNSSTYPGFLWRLAANSVNIKQESPDIQWFYNAVFPMVHYVPVKHDLSDLLEKIEWIKTHDHEAKQISENAQKLVREHLKISDIYQYLYILLNHYRAIIDFEPELLDGIEDRRFKDSGFKEFRPS